MIEMDDNESLRAELLQLRQQIEAYRQRELEELRSRLAAAEAAANHYRGEAERNVQIGHQIHAEAQQQIADLRTRLESKERLDSVRPPGPGRPQ